MSLKIVCLIILLQITHHCSSTRNDDVESPGLTTTFNIKEKDGANIFIIGDWGILGSTKPSQSDYAKQIDVANAMDKYAAQHKPKFIISLGDNFYENGISPEYGIAKRFNETFINVYLKGNLKQSHWYIVNGNHDHRLGRGVYQLDHFVRHPLWHFPDFLQRIDINLLSDNLQIKSYVRLVLADTTVLCNLWGNTDITPQQNATKELLNIDYYNRLRAYLADDLKQKDQKIIIIGHHPIYSATEYRETTQCMETYFKNLIDNAPNVVTYISGHDHLMQHNSYYSYNGKRMHLFTAGSGSMFKSSPEIVETNQYENHYFTNATNPTYGFMNLEIKSNNRFNFNFVDTNGTITYNFENQF
jgi:tartrate-resistant acid phosphatase type 5